LPIIIIVDNALFVSLVSPHPCHWSTLSGYLVISCRMCKYLYYSSLWVNPWADPSTTTMLHAGRWLSWIKGAEKRKIKCVLSLEHDNYIKVVYRKRCKFCFQHFH